MNMVFDSQQQKETVFQFMQMVRIDAPYQVARQQIIQLDDMMQMIIAGEVKPSETPKEMEPEDK